MPALLPILLASSHIWLAAERVPVLDIEPSCRAAASAAISGGRNEDACKKDEQAARTKLEQNWNQFTPTQQAHCVRLSTLGGSPSYVELLTCLEIDKAASGLKDGNLGRERIER
jgi:hypothetical protein